MGHLKYEIISSGSHGNCVVIEEVMVDCGLPFSKIKDYLYGIKYLLITHIHSDHIKKSTLQSIRRFFPKIKVIGNYEVHQLYNVDIIANAMFPIVVEDYTFVPFLCDHDVLTYGYTWSANNYELIYATDTSSLANVPEGQFDYFFIESNHDEHKLNEVLKNTKIKYNAYLGGKRHLSTQQAKGFYYSRRKNKESQFIELHKSSRFY